MDSASIEGQSNLAPGQPDEGSTLEIPSKLKNPFQPRAELIKAIMGQESGGNAKAVGKVGERGLMQIRPETAAQYGVKPDQLFDPNINQSVGTRYFSDLLKKYKGNEFMALMAYNSGPGRVDKGQYLPQSIKYATGILDKAKGGAKPQGKDSMPTMEAQAQFGEQAKPPEQASSLLSKIGGLFEGTANAEEPGGPGMPPAAQMPPGSSYDPNAPPTPAGLPPLPTGEAYNPGPGAAVPKNLPPLPTGEQYQPDVRTSIGFGPGGFSMRSMTVPPPASVRTQAATANIVLGQVNDAIGFYDKNIKPREGEFTGNLLSKGGRQGFVQPFEATHSRWAQALGMGQGDPQVKTLYDKVGPVMAEQLKTLIGGRVGQGMIDGPLAPHLPNIEQDSLPRIREKLQDLKANIPIIIQNIQGMRAQGMTDDQILAQPPTWPVDQGQGGPSGLSPDEQELLQKYQ